MAKSSINNYETIHVVTFFDPDTTGIWSTMKLEVQVNKNHPKYVNLMLNEISVYAWLHDNTPELMETMLKAMKNHTQNSNYHFVRVRVVPETLH